ncbi:MAG: methylated-DNA--[protein]-cysteine S-methyltransferase [Bacteroidota bacterium]
MMSHSIQPISSFSFQAYRPHDPVYYACYPHPIKDILLLTTQKGICGLHFLIQPLDTHLQLMAKSLGTTPQSKQTYPDIFWHTLQQAHLPTISLVLVGTPFQQQVWQALCRIPHGTTTHYQAISHKLNKPQSTRAVANAIAKNHIAWLIPCHRVLRKSGQLGGYRWGVQIKKNLLIAERQSS